jgi:NAD-dependent deacetylase
VQNKNHAYRLQEPILVLTGAGISAESGIPTFRGKDGLWKQYRAQDLATPQAFDKNPQLVWQFYDWRRQVISSCKPNPAHLILMKMEQVFSEFLILTQNVDGLHFQAGNKQVLELHGSIWALKCITCDHRWTDREVPLPELPPRCPSCNGLARPDVVWFGESLKPWIMKKAEEASRSSKTMLVIGTSALVQPANLLPLIAKGAGSHLIEFNLEPTSLSPYADGCHFGPAGKTLPLWWNKFNHPSEGFLL